MIGLSVDRTGTHEKSIQVCEMTGLLTAEGHIGCRRAGGGGGGGAGSGSCGIGLGLVWPAVGDWSAAGGALGTEMLPGDLLLGLSLLLPADKETPGTGAGFLTWG